MSCCNTTLLLLNTTSRCTAVLLLPIGTYA